MNLGRAARNVGGWLLTIVGVVVIIVATTADYRFSGSAGVVIAVAAAVSTLVPVLAGAAYMTIRRRNRSAEAAEGVMVSPRARAVQTSLASVLDRVNDSTDDALGLRRVVLGDRLELTATALLEVGDRWDALSFIWFVRPSQAGDFPWSQHMHNLPVWAQDAVVLLDLRRELQLRGTESALSDEPGFYRHGFARVCAAARRAGSGELVDVLLAARRDVGQRQRLLELLDDVRVWGGLAQLPPSGSR